MFLRYLFLNGFVIWFTDQNDKKQCRIFLTKDRNNL